MLKVAVIAESAPSEIEPDDVGQGFVVGTAEVIRDPDSGEVLDTNMTEVARLEVTEAKEKLSIAKITKGNATGVRKGMEVHTQ